MSALNKPIKIFALSTQKKIDGALRDKLLEYIDEDKKERINKFYKWQDAQRSLLAELLVRTVLIRSAGLHNAAISFSTSAFGKPFLTNFAHLHFNSSHAGNWVVCTVESKEVGIDVEQITAIDLSIAENFFCASEHQDIIASPNPNDKFFDYWTLKESYIKFIGKGLSHPLNAFNIKFINDKHIGIEAGGELIKEVYFKQYPIEAGYKLAVCATHNNFERNISICTIDDIIDTVK